MALSNIVVGVDFSTPSHAALTQAKALAKAHGAKLVLVHGSGVTDSGMYVRDVTGREDEPWRMYVEDHLRSAREQLDKLADEAKSDGITVEKHLASEFGDAAITAVAQEIDADLVVVGTHGRTGLDRVLLGSVAERVVRLCRRNVMVARDTGAPVPPKRVLVPTDFSDTSELGLKLALLVAAPDAEVELMHCWLPPYQGGGDYLPAWMQNDLKQEGLQRGEALLRAHGGTTQTLRYTQRETTPLAGIQKQLEGGGYHAVVIGSHGRRGLRRMLLGSVAEQTVRYAPLSVYVAHPGFEGATPSRP